MDMNEFARIISAFVEMAIHFNFFRTPVLMLVGMDCVQKQKYYVSRGVADATTSAVNSASLKILVSEFWHSAKPLYGFVQNQNFS